MDVGWPSVGGRLAGGWDQVGSVGGRLGWFGDRGGMVGPLELRALRGIIRTTLKRRVLGQLGAAGLDSRLGNLVPFGGPRGVQTGRVMVTCHAQVTPARKPALLKLTRFQGSKVESFGDPGRSLMVASVVSVFLFPMRRCKLLRRDIATALSPWAAARNTFSTPRVDLWSGALGAMSGWAWRRPNPSLASVAGILSAKSRRLIPLYRMGGGPDMWEQGNSEWRRGLGSRPRPTQPVHNSGAGPQGGSRGRHGGRTGSKSLKSRKNGRKSQTGRRSASGNFFLRPPTPP